MSRRRRYEVQPLARADLEQAADYIARRSPVAGRRFFGAAERAFRAAAKRPGLGMRFESINPEVAGLRWVTVPGYRSYLVIYRVLPDSVEIVRVLHGARDLDRLLGDEAGDE